MSLRVNSWQAVKNLLNVESLTIWRARVSLRYDWRDGPIISVEHSPGKESSLIGPFLLLEKLIRFIIEGHC